MLAQRSKKSFPFKILNFKRKIKKRSFFLQNIKNTTFFPFFTKKRPFFTFLQKRPFFLGNVGSGGYVYRTNTRLHNYFQDQCTLKNYFFGIRGREREREFYYFPSLPKVRFINTIAIPIIISVIVLHNIQFFK